MTAQLISNSNNCISGAQLPNLIPANISGYTVCLQQVAHTLQKQDMLQQINTTTNISSAQLFYFCLPRELCVGEEDVVPSLLDEPGEGRLVVLKVGSW